MTIRSKTLRGVFIVAIVATISTLAQAQMTEAERKDAAKKLYTQAIGEMVEKNYDNACPLLEEVLRIAPEAIGGMITLGECYQEAKRLPEALATFRHAENVAMAQGDAARQKKAATKAAVVEGLLGNATTNAQNDSAENLDAAHTPTPLPGEKTLPTPAAKTPQSPATITSPLALIERLEHSPEDLYGDERSEPKTKRANGTMMVAGSTLGITGVLETVVGVVMLAGSMGDDASPTTRGAGAGLLIAGFLVGAIGIPLFTTGFKQVPIHAGPHPVQATEKPATSLRLLVGPASAYVRMTF